MPCAESAPSEPGGQPRRDAAVSDEDSAVSDEARTVQARLRTRGSERIRASAQPQALDSTLSSGQPRTGRVEPCAPAEPCTDEWVAWLGTALAGNRVDESIALTIEHRVVGEGGEVFRWHVRLACGRVDVGHGPAPEGDADLLAFTSDYDTARGIARGEKSAQLAFLEGRLRLDGDIRLLIENRSALGALRIQSVCQD